MEKNDWPTIIGTLCILFFLAYLSVKIMKTYLKTLEGLTNSDPESSSTSSTTAKSAPVTTGAAGSAASYAESIKASTVKIQDELLISKYRKDYENVIINMEDNMSAVMLKIALSAKDVSNPSEVAMIATKIAALSTAKTALNDVMKYVDSQPSDSSFKF